MAVVTIRDLSDEAHRALSARAAGHSRSPEAEMREILEAAGRPNDRVKLGALLASIAQEAGGLTEAEADGLERLRDRTPPDPMGFA